MRYFNNLWNYSVQFESLILCQKQQIPNWVSAVFICSGGDSSRSNAARTQRCRRRLDGAEHLERWMLGIGVAAGGAVGLYRLWLFHYNEKQ
jgi:hypothetical protein